MDLKAFAAKLTPDQVSQMAVLLGFVPRAEADKLAKQVEEQKRQLDWFRRQYFGARSERRILEDLSTAEQMWLGEQMLEVPEEPPASGTTVKAYERKARKKTVTFVESDSRLRFDESVPVEVIQVSNPELEGIPAEELVQISEKVTYRLAQRPSYVLLKYVQPVMKRTSTGSIFNSPAPPAIFERSFADVSVLAGMITDKCHHHLPLYRQHQRLGQAGFSIHRGTMTRLFHRTADLLEPIYLALLSSVLESKILTMDESPTPAGVTPAVPATKGIPGKPGKVKRGYFWVIYGDKDEVVFVFDPSRGTAVVDKLLQGFDGKLQTDGYIVYESFIDRTGLVHAICWAHVRRYFIDAEKFEPVKVGRVLRWMRILYRVEKSCAERSSAERLAARQRLSRRVVNRLFNFFQQELDKTALLPSNPFIEALEYATKRERELRVFLDDGDMRIDSNHVERALRGPAVGRRNWMFHVTEVGARYAGICYSLIQSCLLHDVNPTVYLIDVLQRIDRHPATEVHLLTPRLWKEHFAHQPLRSDVFVRAS